MEQLLLNNMNQEEFENHLMSFITDGDHDGLLRLKKQFKNAKVISREMTGVGFFTNLAVDNEVVEAFPKDFNFGDVMIQADDLEDSAGVLVYITNGYLSSIECYSFGDTWSDGYPNLKFSYLSEVRDLSSFD